MHLGEVLIHAGIIDSDQLTCALRVQVERGGRLGTNLIELGWATLDQTAHGLARVHGVPAALEKHLRNADQAALALMNAELCERYLALPIAFANANGRRLVVCFRDPTDKPGIEAVTAATQMPIIPSVAPELGIFSWLYHRYKVEAPRRFRKIADAQHRRASVSTLPPMAHPGSDCDPLSAMQLVELDHRDVAKDHSQNDFEVQQRTKSGTISGLHAARGVLPTKTLANPAHGTPAPEQTRKRTPTLVAAPPPQAARTSPEPVPEPEPEPVPAKQPEYPNIDVEQAANQIADAEHRKEIAHILTGYLHTHFGGGLIAIVKGDLALGHMGFGGSFDQRSVESIVVPLASESMFERAHSTRKPFRGPPPADGDAVQKRFFKLFPLDAPPEEVVVVPVVLGKKVACLVYAHAPSGHALKDTAVAELERLAKITEQAFLRIIKTARAQT